MMIFFQSRELAAKLDINLAKWKRWVREFLPPDPLGGLQSGYARQFSQKSAFRVYLGGYLVAALKFSIPEAVRILDDLDAWLRTNGFFALHPHKAHVKNAAAGCWIYIYSVDHQHFGYSIRSIVAQPTLGADGLFQEKYSRTLFNATDDPLSTRQVESARILEVSALYQNFMRKLGQ
jgi:hypothetical protein